MYRGRFRQGEYVPLLCHCRNASDVATVPDNSPLAVIWGPSNTKVESFKIPVAERYTTIGAVAGALFAHFLRLGNAYATTGPYQVVYHYVAGTHTGIEVDDFEVVAGGHKDGNVIAAYWYQRPQAAFVVQQYDSGRLKASRNPRI